MSKNNDIREISWVVKVGVKQVVRNFTAQDLISLSTAQLTQDNIRKELTKVIKDTILDDFITSAQYLITGSTDKNNTVESKPIKKETPEPVKIEKQPTVAQKPEPVEVKKDHKRPAVSDRQKADQLLKEKLAEMKRGGSGKKTGSKVKVRRESI